MADSAALLRKAELAVLCFGLLIVLIAMAWASRGAFQANMAWTQGAERTPAGIYVNWEMNTAETRASSRFL
jgi:hypothetical protein